MNKPTTITELGRGFQLDLFHEIITDPKFGETVIDKLEVTHFNVEAFQKIVTILKKYYEKHETILNFPNLKTEIKMQVPESTLRSQLIDTVIEIENKPTTNKNVQEFATKFVKLQSLKHVLQDISKKVEKGVVDDYDLIEKKLKDALVYKDVQDPISLDHNIDAALSDQHREPIPTGIEGLDEIMAGGLAKAELALVIAPLGVGKTTFLTKVANTAYMAGKNVLQIFFEDKNVAVQQKHFSIMSKIALPDLVINKVAVSNRVNKIFESQKKKSNNQLLLQKLPADGVTVTKIKNIIKKLNAKGTKIDLLVLDYVDCICMEKEIPGTEEWSNEGKIMRALETMIEEMNVACWTATQGNRASTSVEVVKTENMGGSLKKAQIAHFIMSIGKTLEQKEAGVATISILKNRLGKDGMVYQNCKFDNATLTIDTGDKISINGMEKEKEKQKVQRLKQVYEDNVKQMATEENTVDETV